jgi:flavodoxin
MNSPRTPSVLFVFYTHTEQSRRVADAMAGVLRERGCDVSLAGIEFTDPRCARKFDRFPFRHAVLDLLAVLPAQVRRSTGQIRIPDAAREGEYDLVCFGSPTWFFTTNMPLRSYLKSAEAGKVLAGKRFAAYVVCRRYWSINLKEVRKLGTAQGGAYADGTPFPVRGRPDPVVAVAAQLLRQGRDARALSRGEDSADQSQAGLHRAGPGVRQ